MKKILLLVLAGFFVTTTVYGASVLQGYQGGTGIGSATAGDVSKCLIVSDDSPFTYTLGTCGTGGGGGSDGNWTFFNGSGIRLATTTNMVGIGTTTPSFSKLAVVGTSIASTTLSLYGFNSQTSPLFEAFTTTGSATTSRFAIDSAGNVGVGTTSPSALLSVNAPAGSDSFAIGSSTSSYFIVNKSGNVGISKANPTSALDVVGSINATGNMTLSNNSDFGWGDRTTRIIGNSSSDSISFMVNNSASLYLDSTGNVGIGSTTPYAKLSVTNTGTGPSFLVEDSTSPDSTPFIIDASGNVGIGTTSPYAKLSVVGETVSSYFTATSSTHSTFPYASSTAFTSSNIYSPNYRSSGTALNFYDDSDNLLSIFNKDYTDFEVSAFGVGTTAPGTLFALGNTGSNTINISETGTSTFGGGGIKLRSGCFENPDGTCAGTGSSGTSLVGGFTQLATSTSMSIDMCDTAYSTSSILALGVGTANIAVTMSGTACLGKYLFVDVWAPRTGLIGSTTFSGVYWNGQINPGANIINGLTDRHMFSVTASSTTFITAQLDSTY